mmetsp:Transcript_56449/g.123687  ORF Transcript_56449/g.123687 Transcript_56449/m.123687 type:complete len:247 (-) Transcript_56449:818-1558(-)
MSSKTPAYSMALSTGERGPCCRLGKDCARCMAPPSALNAGSSNSLFSISSMASGSTLDLMRISRICCLNFSRAWAASAPVFLRASHKWLLSCLMRSTFASLCSTASWNISRRCSSLRRCRSTFSSLFLDFKASSSRLNSRYRSFLASCSKSLISTSSWCFRMASRRSSIFRNPSSLIILRFIWVWKDFLAFSSAFWFRRISRISSRSRSFSIRSWCSRIFRSKASSFLQIASCTRSSFSSFFSTCC